MKMFLNISSVIIILVSISAIFYCVVILLNDAKALHNEKLREAWMRAYQKQISKEDFYLLLENDAL